MNMTITDRQKMNGSRLEAKLETISQMSKVFESKRKSSDSYNDQGSSVIAGNLNKTFNADKSQKSNVIRQYLESVRSNKSQINAECSDIFSKIKLKLAYEWKNIYRTFSFKENSTLG